MYEFSSSLSRGCLFHYAFQVQLARGSCRACVAFISFCFSFFVFFPSLFAKYNFYSYAIEQLLSCRVRWHPRPTPALGMSQQGKGDILTSGSAWVFICWDVNIRWGSEQFFGGSAIPRVYLPIVSASSLVVFWQRGSCNFFSRDQRKANIKFYVAIALVKAETSWPRVLYGDSQG
jgi:hypothetical protein